MDRRTKDASKIETVKQASWSHSSCFSMITYMPFRLHVHIFIINNCILLNYYLSSALNDHLQVGVHCSTLHPIKTRHHPMPSNGAESTPGHPDPGTRETLKHAFFSCIQSITSDSCHLVPHIGLWDWVRHTGWLDQAAGSSSRRPPGQLGTQGPERQLTWPREMVDLTWGLS